VDPCRPGEIKVEGLAAYPMVAAVAKVVEGNQCPRVFAQAGDATQKLGRLQEAKGADGDWRVVNRVNHSRR